MRDIQRHAQMPAPVFMFSGQGSHYFQMAGRLYRTNASFRTRMDRLDAIAAREVGASVVGYVLDARRSPADPFTRTLYSHPAIYMIECALAGALIERGVFPRMLMGSSLGTFAAAAVGGAIDEAEGLRACVALVRMLEAHCAPGAMLAVISEPGLFDALPALHRNTELAGVNMPRHFVVSGTCEGVAEAQRALASIGIDHLRLNVEFAFHSRQMLALRDGFAGIAEALAPGSSRWPIACSAQVRIFDAFTAEDLWNIAVQPIRFMDTMRMVERMGAHHYLDLGPSGTLATFARYCMPTGSGSEADAILTPFGDESANFSRAIARCGTSASPGRQHEVS